MAQKHTIETLTKDVESFKRSTSNRFGKITDHLEKIEPQVQEMHDFIVDYRGFERGRGTLNKDGTININKDVWALILKLVGLIAAILGIKKLT